MQTKLISTDIYLLLIDEEAEISKGNYIYSVLYGIGQIIRDIGGESTKRYRPLIAKFQESEVQQEYGRDGIWQMDVVGEKVAKNNCKKVIAYRKLNEEAKELEGLPLLPSFEEDDIEKLAYDWLYSEKTERKAREGYPLKPMEYGFIEGYKAAQAKQFSLDDVKKAFQAGSDFGSAPFSSQGKELITEEKYIQSLSTQQLPKEFIPEYITVPISIHSGFNMKHMSSDVVLEIKTITNSEGKEELVGTYKY